MISAEKIKARINKERDAAIRGAERMAAEIKSRAVNADRKLCDAVDTALLKMWHTKITETLQFGLRLRQK